MPVDRDNARDRRREKRAGLPILLVLVVLIAALLVWQWQNLTSWATSTAYGIWALLGWGLILVEVALVVAIFVIFKEQLIEFLYRFRHWNLWLSGLAFFLAFWGTLGLLGLGGAVGLAIIESEDIIGVLRVLALTALGIVLAAPRFSFRALVGLVSGAVRLFRAAPQPVKKASPRPALPPPQSEPAAEPPIPVPERPRKERKAEVPFAPTPAQELKQIAREVWKKYGEAPGLVVRDGWKLPPIDILDRSPEVEFAESDNVIRAKKIEEALASYGVEVRVVQINAGPTVTQFGIEPGWDRKTREVKEKDKDGNVRVRQEEVSRTRVKVERITSLANDLALALAAPTIRIEAPVPGKPVVGIEVPNIASSVVSLRGVIETSAYQKTFSKSNLAIALGKGAGGEAIAADLAKMPHLLIAGATGSGKTVCLNAVICGLLIGNTPNDIQFILVDPKRVELTQFNSIPHLATPVIVDSNKALATLRWLNQEMDRRYQVMAKSGARNVEGYNRGRKEGRMPYLILVIDELADLMMTGFEEVEHILCRLAQLSRATGIHLVVATQRPSVDVVTGLIKANFPTRISFAVTSQVDSRTILDGAGAEKLLGKGDMLYMPTDAAKPKRLQGCYVSDPEIERLVYFWGSQRKEEAASTKVADLQPVPAKTGDTGVPEDPLLESARQLLGEHKRISTSFLQRKLHIGYPRAARLMELLEQKDEGDGDEGPEA